MAYKVDDLNIQVPTNEERVVAAVHRLQSEAKRLRRDKVLTIMVSATDIWLWDGTPCGKMEIKDE